MEWQKQLCQQNYKEKQIQVEAQTGLHIKKRVLRGSFSNWKRISMRGSAVRVLKIEEGVGEGGEWKQYRKEKDEEARKEGEDTEEGDNEKEQ